MCLCLWVAPNPEDSTLNPKSQTLNPKAAMCDLACECADFFAKNRMLPEVREGDILAILDTGAYGMCMATNYQLRVLPAEILIDGSEVRIIRPRETFDSLLTKYPAL